jgi:hypothetical protein
MTNDDNPVTEENEGMLIKKLLILELFKLGVPQTEIGKKLKTDIHAVNNFLKGVKKPLN